jgi:hypothetical protein
VDTFNCIVTLSDLCKLCLINSLQGLGWEQKWVGILLWQCFFLKWFAKSHKKQIVLKDFG